MMRAGLAASFLRQGRVHEIHLCVHPVLIGRGTPLFPRTDAMAALGLVRSRTFANGLVLLHYRRARGEEMTADTEAGGRQARVSRSCAGT